MYDLMSMFVSMTCCAGVTRVTTKTDAREEEGSVSPASPFIPLI